MKVIYRNKEVDLDNKFALGAGGEANVIKYGNLAFKIYHQITKERIEKLTSFLSQSFKLPTNVLAPKDIVYDSRNKAIGFTMDIARGCAEVLKLSNKVFRGKQRITTNDILKLFLHMRTTTEQIHQSNLVIGDYNDLNVLFNDDYDSVFIDVDSYQFEKYPCPVGTDQFLDPQLFGYDLSKNPSFSKETDYYAFAVMLFKCLLFVHPYGGIHNQYKNMFDRIKNNVTVFDKGVIYPKIGLPPDSLSDNFLNYFEQIFKKNKRTDLSVQMLQQLQGSFIECNKCGIYFSNTRGKCPGCQKTIIKPVIDLSQIVTTQTIDKIDCSMTPIFSNNGQILFVKVIEDRIIVINYNGTTTDLHEYKMNKEINSIELWNGYIRNLKFDFFDKYLVVGTGTELMIFEIQLHKKIPVTKTTTMMYKESSVFSCSQQCLYRLTDKAIMRTKVLYGNLVDEIVCSAMENQTYFQVGQYDLGLGFYRIYNKFQHFVFSEKGRYEIELDHLDGQLIEVDIRNSIVTTLLLRKVLYNGRTYSHIHLIDSLGKVLETRVEESINSELLRNIYGKELAGSNIIHPTDAGIVIEKHGNISLKTSTVDYVTSDSSLLLYEKGILIISENEIRYIILKS